MPQVSGSWRWVSSTGSIAGRTFTPATESYQVRHEFSGNQVRAFRNDSLMATSLITVTDDEITFQPSFRVLLSGYASGTQTLEVLAADTLVLRDPCCDLLAHRFVRWR